MQLAKVELFGINICGQQRYSNNATNNNNCKSIGRNNDHPVLFVFVLYWYCIGISVRVYACLCVWFLCTLCAHCLGSVCIFQFVLWIMQFI